MLSLTLFACASLRSGGRKRGRNGAADEQAAMDDEQEQADITGGDGFEEEERKGQGGKEPQQKRPRATPAEKRATEDVSMRQQESVAASRLSSRILECRSS